MNCKNSDSFKSARPVWAEGREEEMNLSILFRAKLVRANSAKLRIAAHTRYLVRVNGEFLSIGPARAAHDFYRVDEYDIGKMLTRDENILSVLVAGYNCNSGYLLDRPSFLCAEAELDGEIAAATGKGGFEAAEYTERVQKIQRYSFQRPFAECYHIDENFLRFERDADFSRPALLCAATADKVFIPRGICYPEYEVRFANEVVAKGKVNIRRRAEEELVVIRAVHQIGKKLKGFKREDIPEITSLDVQNFDYVPHEGASEVNPGGVFVGESEYVTFGMERNTTGLIEALVEVNRPCTLYITFDEILTEEGKVNEARYGCSNVVTWHIEQGGKYNLCSFEPYTMRYMNVISIGGDLKISGLSIRRVDFPAGEINFKVKLPSERLEKIYEAALETFRQNTVDIYMDCPSRERAGWLCDSFFTSRVERVLTGKSQVERNFLENFTMPPSFEHIPDGMLPMCYPSDCNHGKFIPNWAMWFLIELREYLARSGDRELVGRAHEKMYKLLAYFRKFENPDGLLEKLDGVVFVDWSMSNKLVQDINYPTNMLYARFKEDMGALYNDAALADEAERLREVIREQSYTGEFFCDNAVYDESGVARLSGERTETCQYYAFFTGVATPSLYPRLWETLVQDFGPGRKESGKYPEIYPSNAFIGNYLRIELMFNAGLYSTVERDIDGYFYKMAEKTGTLWEYDTPHKSCNHGFASHVIYWFDKMYNR